MEILKGLNRQQKEAVTTTQGPLLIIAGAGSGKTKVLTHRIAYLIQEEKVSPQEILAVTFTNKAAQEMKERVSSLVGLESQKVWLSTFHSLGVRILRRDINKLDRENNFVIFSTADQTAVIKECLKELNIDSKKYPPALFLGNISKAKNELLTLEGFQAQVQDFMQAVTARVYEFYQKKLRGNNALDFDDLIMKTVQLLQTRPDILEYYQEKFRYLMVDEYQDTNQAQYQLVRLMAARYRNLCVVGDEDQSIYGWRGADIRNILDFERDYPEAKVIKLEENYRSTEVILDAANGVIRNNRERKEKKLRTSQKGGESITYYRAEDQHDEARFIAQEIRRICQKEGRKFSEFALLYRTNAQSRVFEEVFMREGVPYKIVGGTKFYDRKEIKDIIAYLRVIFNPVDSVSLSRIINVPKRSIGDSTVEKIIKFAQEKDLAFYQALSQVDQVESLSARSKQSVKKFLALMENLKQTSSSIRELINAILKQTGYLAELERENSTEAESRIENLKEFLSVAEEFAQRNPEGNLDLFLEQITLVSDIDSLDEEENGIILMTLHSAKGLEFPVVFMVGMEEGIFPHFRALNASYEIVNREMEEERRLCYVGITRAREQLYLTSAWQRMIYGSVSCNSVSRFLEEIPDCLLVRI